MAGENLGGQSKEVHGMDASGWAEFYGFEAIKDYPYNPVGKVHLAGKAEDGSAVTVSSRDLIGAYLGTSVAADGGEDFVEEVVTKSVSLIDSWFVEVSPGEYKFDMSKKA